MRFRVLISVLLLAFQGISCAQVKKVVTKESLADRVALRIAIDRLIKDSFKEAKDDLISLGRFPEPLDEPLDFKVARILVNEYADIPGGTLDSAAKLLEVSTRFAVDITTLIAQKPEYDNYLDTILEFAAKGMEAKNKSARLSSEDIELRSYNSLTPERVKAIAQTAEKLPSLRSPKTLQSLAQFRIGIVHAIARHPEYLKPFTEEKPASAALQASWARVQKLLQSAKSEIAK